MLDIYIYIKPICMLCITYIQPIPVQHIFLMLMRKTMLNDFKCVLHSSKHFNLLDHKEVEVHACIEVVFYTQ